MDAFKIFGMYVLIYFFGLGLLEVAWHVFTKRRYNWQESIVSVMDMIIRRTILFLVGGTLLIWVAPWLQQFRFADLPLTDAGVWHWGRVAVLFFGLEFLYYWFHRWSHEIRWFWATHAVHHSPNSMNFMTAERLGWTQNLSGAMLVFAPLILIGFRTNEILGMFSINLLYQYWLHTEMIGKLGPLEIIFNTPSHHRVHHASNPTYLDANYGGILIIFDRLFGTFIQQRTEEKIVFGLVTPLKSSNPFYVALHEWINIAVDVRSNWRQPKILIGYLFGRPGWSHDGSRMTSSQILASAKVNPNVSNGPQLA